MCMVLLACGGDRPQGYYKTPPLVRAGGGSASDTVAPKTPPRGADAAVRPTHGDAPKSPGPPVAGGGDVLAGPDLAETSLAETSLAVEQVRDAAAGDDAASTSTPDNMSGPSAAPVGGALPEMPLPNFASLFKRLSPSVVNIYTSEVVRRRLPRRWSQPEQGTALGSGLIYTADGQILTNAHVVENAAEIRVRFHDREELPARLVGIDPVRDLALLKVDGRTDLIPVVPGDSDKVSVGDWVLAIGNPFGLSHTLTKGIVSAKGRVEFVSENMGYMDLIQTDAAINEGNSGGPLFDLRGHVVGLATAVSAEGQGISFAIPWRQVRDALPRLEQGGQVSRSWLGIYLRPTDPSIRPSKDVQRGGGVLVAGVVDDSPAAQAKLEPGDIVVRFGDRPVNSINEFRLSVAASVAGKPVALTIVRAGARKVVKAILREAR